VEILGKVGTGKESRVLFTIIQRRIHKAIDLSQVSVLSGEVLKDIVESGRASHKELAGLAEKIASENIQMGELLEELRAYLGDIELPRSTNVGTQRIIENEEEEFLVET
jgi:hypothetical protein